MAISIETAIVAVLLSGRRWRVPRAYVQGCCREPGARFQFMSEQPAMAKAVVGLALQPSHWASIEHGPENDPAGAVTVQVFPEREMVTVCPATTATVPAVEENTTGTGGARPGARTGGDTGGGWSRGVPH